MFNCNEKFFKQLKAYLQENGGEELGKDGLEKLAREFIDRYNARLSAETEGEPKTSDDYLELAGRTSAKKKRLEYINKALELEPDNLDACLQFAIHNSKDKHELLNSLEKLVEKGGGQMKKAGYLPKRVGDFWLVWETRPYMRVRYCYFNTLIELGMMRRAIKEGERLLELCKVDNLGVRFELMHLYAYLEDEASALALHKRFDAHEETMLLFPLAVLYYKTGKFDKAEDCLRLLRKLNKGTKKFLSAAARSQTETLMASTDSYGYAVGTIEEFLEEYDSYQYLFKSVPHFFGWANKIIK